MAYWNFDADTNADSVGDFDQSTMTGTVTYANAPTGFGRTGVFDGVSYFTCQSPEDLAGVAVGSVTFRFNSTNLSPGSPQQHNTAVSLVGTTGNVMMGQGQSSIAASVGGHLNWTGSLGTTETPADSVAINTWYTVLWSDNGTTRTVAYKADGGSVVTGTEGYWGATTGFFAACGPDNNPSATVLTIGHDSAQGTAATRTMKGFLDDIAIFDHVLTAAEQTTLWTEGVGAVIPEPATMLVLALGGLATLIRRRR